MLGFIQNSMNHGVSNLCCGLTDADLMVVGWAVPTRYVKYSVADCVVFWCSCIFLIIGCYAVRNSSAAK